MKTSIIITAIGLQALIANAQTTVTTANGQAFQFTTVTGGQGVRVKAMVGMPGKIITGRPVTATEERHTLQILGDGTRIENTNTNKFYRDDLGRTRTERADGTVLINDPGQGTAEIQGDHIAVRRSDKTEITTMIDKEITTQLDKAKLDKLMAEAGTKEQANQEENLGYQSVSGVTAQGFRTTTTIPAGQIGNDRPIVIVSERWYSADLQMNVKTTNSDPRFGETTYQLTNILQTAPDPTLFRIPAQSK
jgi:hypothetical protein